MRTLVAALFLSLAVTSALSHAAPPADAGSNIVWRDCFDGLDCGRLRVPLDYSRPREASIEIALIRVPARVPEQRIGSLLVNFGGPGGPGVEGVLLGADAFPGEIQDRFDIIGFDPRGVGTSDIVDCVDDFSRMPPVDSQPDSRSYDVQARFWRAFARSCQQRSGNLLQFVDTASTARDMDRIREELGDQYLTYIGFSYGTLLGAKYAELFPGRFRAIVLDGVLDPANNAHDTLVEAAEGADIAFGGFIAACAAAPACPFKAPDLRAAFDEVVAEARVNPLPGWDFPITGDDVLAATFGALYSSDSWISLAEALRQARDDHSGVGFGLLISGIGDDEPPEEPQLTNPFEAFSAIACVDFLAIDGEREFARIADDAAAASPRWGRHLAWSLAFPCAFWPGAPRREVAPLSPASASILVISGKFDPITRYDWGVAVADQLQSAALLTYEGYGHVSHGSCAASNVVAYIVFLELPSVESCANADDPFPATLLPPGTEPPGVAPPPDTSAPGGTITPPNTGRPAGTPPPVAFIAVGLALIAAGIAVAVATRGLPERL